jgi:hypothetical protein
MLNGDGLGDHAARRGTDRDWTVPFRVRGVIAAGEIASINGDLRFDGLARP